MDTGQFDRFRVISPETARPAIEIDDQSGRNVGLRAQTARNNRVTGIGLTISVGTSLPVLELALAQTRKVRAWPGEMLLLPSAEAQ